MNIIFTLLFVFLLHKKVDFCKMSKTHHKMNVFSPLKKSVKKVVRRPHYLWDFMHIPVSSSFAILPHRTPPLAAQDAHDAKHMVFSIQDGP